MFGPGGGWSTCLWTLPSSSQSPMESSRMASFLIPQCEGASHLTSLLFSHLPASPFGAHTLFFFFLNLCGFPSCSFLKQRPFGNRIISPAPIFTLLLAECPWDALSPPSDALTPAPRPSCMKPGARFHRCLNQEACRTRSRSGPGWAWPPHSHFNQGVSDPFISEAPHASPSSPFKNRDQKNEFI